MNPCLQAVESELLGVLTATADRGGCNKSLLVVGPRGSGKTLVCSLTTHGLQLISSSCLMATLA